MNHGVERPNPDGAGLTVQQALAEARTQGMDRLDAQLIVGHVMQRPRSWLLAHDDATLSPAQTCDLRSLIAQRAQGIPMAYLLGEKEFHGLTLRVTPDVLIPRPDTETLVDWALELLGPDPLNVIDLGTGSGAIALALKAARPAWRVHATDCSAAALAVAQDNAQRLGLALSLRRSHWLSDLGVDLAHDLRNEPTPLRFDLMVSNPPYIDADDPHMAALHAEPRGALTPGPDGLADLRHIIESAGPHLQPGAWLLLEHGWNQAPAVQSLLTQAGFEAVTTRKDLSGQPRCTAGRWPGDAGSLGLPYPP